MLDTIVCMFSQYCKDPYTVEMCEVRTGGQVKKYPLLKNRQMAVTAKNVNQHIGINLSAESIAKCLTRMCLGASVEKKNIVVFKFLILEC